MWGATLVPAHRGGQHRDFNPRTPCGVRPPDTPTPEQRTNISIHAPRVGCDVAGIFYTIRQSDFNPRTPCGVRPFSPFGSRAVIYFNPRTPWGVRLRLLNTQSYTTKFQSTHPVWGATAVHPHIVRIVQISIHAPRVGCDDVILAAVQLHAISIHAPRVGCDRNKAKLRGQPHAFQSTHPVWGATPLKPFHIGIDADFNPRTPGGVRPQL